MIWDPIPAPFLWLGLICHLYGSYKHPCKLSHLYPMMYGFFWYIVFFFVMLSFLSMCKSLKDKKSSIQFLVLFSKFNFLKMPIKSITKFIFGIFLVLWNQKKGTKDKKIWKSWNITSVASFEMLEITQRRRVLLLSINLAPYQLVNIIYEKKILCSIVRILSMNVYHKIFWYYVLWC